MDGKANEKIEVAAEMFYDNKMRKAMFFTVLCLFFLSCFHLEKNTMHNNKYNLKWNLGLRLILDERYDIIHPDSREDTMYLQKVTTFSYVINNHSDKPVVFNSLAVSWNYSDEGFKIDSAYFQLKNDFSGEYERGVSTNECGFDYSSRYNSHPILTKFDTINHLIIIPAKDSISRKLLMYACDGEQVEKMYNPPTLYYRYKGDTEFKIQLIYDNTFDKHQYDSIWIGRLESNIVDF